MFEFLAASENLPFVAALLLMLLIGLVEAIGLGAGAIHLDLGADTDLDTDLLGWLGVGQVPLLILLVVFLALFGTTGIAIQQIAEALIERPLSLWVAAPAALAATLPLLGVSARGLARILPGDETTAIDLDSLVGKRATVTVGTARRGSPAQAKVRDIHGQMHFVMMEPHDDRSSVAAGERVLLVRREGGLFIGLVEGDALIPRLDEPAVRFPREMS